VIRRAFTVGALVLGVIAAGCSRRSVTVDPGFDPCASSVTPLALDDSSCSDDDVGNDRCIRGDLDLQVGGVVTEEDDTIDDPGGTSLEDLVDVEVVTGSLRIRGAPIAVELQQLRSVGGCLEIDTSGAFRVGFESLVEAGRVVVRDRVESVSLPVLRRGDVEVDGARIEVLSLPEQRVGAVIVRNVERLEILSTTTFAGDLVVDGAPRLNRLTAENLVDGHEVGVFDTDLQRLALPNLLGVSRLSVTRSPRLTELALGQLVTIEKSLRITDAPLNRSAICTLLQNLTEAPDEVDVEFSCP